MSFVVLQVVTISFLWCNVATSDTETSSNKSCYGPDYTDPFPFNLSPENMCIHAYYNTSETNSLFISLTYGDTELGTETISEDDPAEQEKQICDAEFPSPFGVRGSPCSLCLGFDNILLSDNWAKICPQFILHCSYPMPVVQTFPMACFFVGDADDDHTEQIVGGNTDFTFNLLYSNAMTQDIVTDLFVSPFGITCSLTMAMMAANGNTLKQIMNSFELNEDDYQIYNSFDTLVQSLQHKSDALVNSVDNRLWINNKWYDQISPQYLKDFDRFGDIIGCNFQNDSYEETQKLDKWVEDVTNNLITQPLAHKNLSSSTVMLFTNVMYLKGNWEIPFTNNISEIFTDDAKQQISIEMMVTDANQFNKYNNSDVEVIELPLKDAFSELSFIMIRPTQQKYLIDGPTSTIQFEKSLNKSLLDEWLNKLSVSSYKEKLMLPFLEMYNLEDITDSLKALGITDLFDPQKCDLKNLTIPHYQVYETDLNRQDYMKITPSGIEIGSITTDGDDGKVDTNQGAIKHADLPFLFLIVDRSENNLILYAGRVTNPKGWRIYTKPEQDESDHTHFIIIIFGLLAMSIISYCIIKFLYNITVMQLRGVNSIPHITHFKQCCQFFNQKINGIYQTDNINNIGPVLGSSEIYAKLNEDDMRL